MRLKQSRIENYFWKPRIIRKDKEGSSCEEYGAAVSFRGESWPVSGKTQAEKYGQRLPYVRNLKIEGRYIAKADDKGRMHYDFGGGFDVRELDGICIYAEAGQKPDYKIISIKAYRTLTLEVEHI
ncbi:MAG: hypothetical protein Q4D16_19610 [Eubacteriales bacterium]|nr:hypothetical protein [Eubacteriales bacterium]